MFFHRLTWDEENPSYTYHTATGSSITIRPGDVSIHDGKVVTAEDLHDLVKSHNNIVYNNIKNGKSPVSDKEKERIREWNKSHPDEKPITTWNASLNYITEDHDNTDKVMKQAYDHAHGDNPRVERLYELIDEMSETQRRAFVMFHLEGMALKDIAEELGCCVSAVSRAVSRAEEFIRKNF